MWLSVQKRYGMTGHDPALMIAPVRANVMQHIDEASNTDKPIVVGRLLADELRMDAIAELGEDPWDVADGDSSGLEAAYASLLDEEGNLREGINGGGPVVYLYRFVLHPDFVHWKRAVLHSFCDAFDADALIVAQRLTTPFTAGEFADLGFELLPPTVFQVSPALPANDRESKFMLRENAGDIGRYRLRDYIEGDPPPALPAHGAWVKSQGPWKRLI